MEKKLYVGNLAYSVDENSLRDLFGQFGGVVSAKIIIDRDSGRSKGFGFVEMESPDQASAAIDGLNGKDHEGRALRVTEARPKEGGMGGGGGGRGPGGGGGYRGGGGGGGPRRPGRM